MPPTKPRDLEKELARKLNWAVTSTLTPHVSTKKRVRAWAWRLACKMVAAKTQFPVDAASSPPDNGMAGGGADGVTRREAHRRGAPSAHPLNGGVTDASSFSQSGDDVRVVRTGEERRQRHSPPTCPHSGCSRRSGARCVRRPAGSDYGWRWPGGSPGAPETPPEGSNDGRHADRPDDRECYLEKSGRELRPAADTEVTIGR